MLCEHGSGALFVGPESEGMPETAPTRAAGNRPCPEGAGVHGDGAPSPGSPVRRLPPLLSPARAAGAHGDGADSGDGDAVRPGTLREGLRRGIEAHGVRELVANAIIFGRSQPQRQEGSRFGAANVSKRQKNRARIFVDGWEQKNGPMPRMGSKKHLELTREAAAQLGEVGYRAKRMMT